MLLRNFSHRTLLVGLVLLFLTTPALNSIHRLQQTESLEQLIQKAKEFINLNKFKDAQKVLSKALKYDKTSFNANVLMTLVYKQVEKRKEAFKYAYEAVRLQPENADGYFLLALLFYETNETGQAKSQIDMAFQKGANFANAYALKGYLELDERNYKAALESFEKALQLTNKDNTAIAGWRASAEFLRNYVEFKTTIASGAITKPMPLNAPRPNYTEEARGKKIQGTVLLNLWISEQGLVKGWILYSRLGYGLDEQAIRAAQQIQFKPATKDGNPISYWQMVAVEFNLR